MAANTPIVQASERRCESEREHREKILVLNVNLRELPVGYKREEVVQLMLPTVVKIRFAHKPDDMGQERRNLFRKLARDDDDPRDSPVEPQQSQGEPAAKAQRLSPPHDGGDGVGIIASSPEPEKEDVAAAPAAAASGSASGLGAPTSPTVLETPLKGTVEVTVAGATHLLPQTLPPRSEMGNPMSLPFHADGVDDTPECTERPVPPGPASSTVGDGGCENGASDQITEEPPSTQRAKFADVMKSFGVAVSRPPIDVADAQQPQ